MTEELQKKIDRAVKLIQQAGRDGDVVEVAYSGGKDSDVILELTKMAGIKYRAIYKNTTIDPPGTIKHAEEMGADVVRPRQTFFELVGRNGFPNRFARFCCKFLKEYKILDRVIIGVRKAESVKRASMYNEPTECRFYGSKKEHVEAFYPILDWSNKEVVDFIEARGIKVHALYYREDGTIDPARRLGCMCCPLQGHRGRIDSFAQYPGMVRAYIRAGQVFRGTHPNAKSVQLYGNIYEQFYRDVFCYSQEQFERTKDEMFGAPDYKRLIEDYFKVSLP